MKPIKDRIKESQDFYNGVAVGIFIGGTGVMMLLLRGNVVIRTEGVYNGKD